MTISAVISVDPGQSNGGLAVFVPGQKTKVAKMPKCITDLRDFFAYYKENYNPIVFLEKLSVRPDDVTAQDSKANMGKLFRIQKMMANYEQIKTILEMNNIPYVMVHPGKWTTYLGLRIKGKKETKQERKNRYKEYAKKNYPNIDVTLWNCDALNIMHFGRKVLVNDLSWVRANIPQKEYDKLF